MKNISIGHSDTLDYNPSKDAGLPIARLNFRNIPLIPETGKDKIFQFDELFPKFRENKELCREERLNKYYQDMNYDQSGFVKRTCEVFEAQNKNEFTVSYEKEIVITCHLTHEKLVFCKDTFKFMPELSQTKYSGTKYDYVDSLDAIAMQVPEDIILQRHRGDYEDYI